MNTPHPLYVDSTDDQIKSYVYGLIRKQGKFLPHLVDNKGFPNQPFTIDLRERIPSGVLDFIPQATIHFNRKGWPVERNYTLNAKIHRA